MQKYIYTLNDEDYIEYMEEQAAESRIVQIRSVLFTYVSVPVGLFALYLTGVRNVYVYAAVLFLFFSLWIPLSKRIIGRIIHAQTVKSLDKWGKRKYSQLEVKINGRQIVVSQNAERKKNSVIGYQMLGTILILMLADGNTLLMPSRVFSEKNDLGKLLLEIK